MSLPRESCGHFRHNRLSVRSLLPWNHCSKSHVLRKLYNGIFQEYYQMNLSVQQYFLFHVITFIINKLTGRCPVSFFSESVQLSFTVSRKSFRKEFKNLSSSYIPEKVGPILFLQDRFLQRNEGKL